MISQIFLQDICARMVFQQFMPHKKIVDHDMVYWLGDLNYRINDFDSAEVKEILQGGKLEELLNADQLRLDL